MKAQISIELIILVSLLLVFLTMMIFSSSSLQTETIKTKVYDEARKLADGIAFEINSAARAGHGYSRKFFIPTSIFGMDFEINITNYFVTISFSQGSVIAPIVVKEIEGGLQSGFNLIRNINGVIRVESANP
ncbi:MAG: hypothetical protein QMD14_01330 [Candidatus Aenigmarchaeota archaeon]|nr:hypothetical protein [Candidatus Aenigmarchaeota archaeon]